MTIRVLQIISICLIFSFTEDGGKKIPKTPPTGDLYVISIGIDNTNAFNGDFNYCKKDAQDYINKITSDFNLETKKLSELNKNGQKEERDKILKNQKKRITNVFTYSLLNNEASLENIKELFKQVIAKATTNDYFIFTFSGVSLESDKGNTYLLPYIENSKLEYLYPDFKEKPEIVKQLFSLVELANLMEQVASANQYVISEAGMGKSFGENLVYRLFESNPNIIAATERNRIIITTNGPGLDRGRCDNREVNNGKLFDYIMAVPQSHQIITNFKKFDFNLYNAENECSNSNLDYVKIYNEEDYRDVLLRFREGTNSRGAKANSVEKEDSENQIKPQETYAFIVATNEYNGQQNTWANLKNPINDAESLSTILETKYNAKIKKVYNKNKDEILKSFIDFKSQVQENDKFLFFIAGHGYYSESFTDGYLVFKDSKDLSEDYTLDSYLSMAIVKRLLDGINAKQVFSIFDVCYGASFELNNADLPIENYSNTTFDNGIKDFIMKTDENYARIVLASGESEVPDYWSNSLDHSPFANKLLSAFENEKDFISPGKIYSYVRGNVTKPILKTFGKHDTTGDFLLEVSSSR